TILSGSIAARNSRNAKRLSNFLHASHPQAYFSGRSCWDSDELSGPTGMGERARQFAGMTSGWIGQCQSEEVGAVIAIPSRHQINQCVSEKCDSSTRPGIVSTRSFERPMTSPQAAVAANQITQFALRHTAQKASADTQNAPMLGPSCNRRA